MLGLNVAAINAYTKDSTRAIITQPLAIHTYWIYTHTITHMGKLKEVDMCVCV